ncbi:DUF3667 domain-containing protein [Phenylobacterium deserti]|uniref:DUF3667 domain-containing protein n=1 Tax=Phenylobacterium deserti TaxID=1914756 RepID=A0A328AVF6_9CAUL|nr:DUF3667 domain-containing protein [Phenylobacterium deserti]RAK56908.1 hypothetical protein DJ018_02760 [Phenylobacterium deserti]
MSAVDVAATQDAQPPASTESSQLETPLADAEAHRICANCQTALVGHFCHQCGQKAHLHDKLSHLAHELVEGIAHFDGRLWRTLPLLAFNPGRLSREWLQGKRMTYVSPLHVFLFAVFLVFLIPNFTGHHLIQLPHFKLDPADTTDARLRGLIELWNQKQADGKYYGYKAETLAYKLAFVLAPVAMLLLAATTWRPSRKSTAYKHGVVALYGLGFAALVASALMLLPKAASDSVGDWAAVALGVHMVVHLRGAYGCSWPGAIARSVVLASFTFLSLSLFVVGVVLLGLTA